MPNAETRGAEAGEEEEDATGWAGPLLSELHIPETQLLFARTKQTWRRRGKCPVFKVFYKLNMSVLLLLCCSQSSRLE